MITSFVPAASAGPVPVPVPVPVSVSGRGLTQAHVHEGRNRQRQSRRRCSLATARMDIAVAAAAASTSRAAPPSAMLFVSRALNLAVLSGAMLYKVPQVARIVRARSADGISTTTYVFETLGLSIYALYALRSGFPFGTFGECVLIAAQNSIILGLMSVYKADFRKRTFAAMLAIFAVLLSVLATPALVPLSGLTVLQGCSAVMTNGSRVPQILLNHRNRGTGQLAPTTMLLQVAGNAARLVTTLVQLGDWVTLATTLASLTINSLLLAQVFIYRPRKT
mmetsp:Transcript_6584/g.17679  ORF Transcript_6584/g.17679 Transcript_6584/m.17679 type:complete len:279 (+) Transcript_6584:89-925(+)